MRATRCVVNVTIERSPRERLWVFVLVFVIATAIVGARAVIRTEAHDLPVTIVVAAVFGLAAALFFDWRVGVSIRALRVARLGTRAEQKALLESRRPMSAQLFLAVEAGELAVAEAVSKELRAEKVKTPDDHLASSLSARVREER